MPLDPVLPEGRHISRCVNYTSQSFLTNTEFRAQKAERICIACHINTKQRKQKEDRRCKKINGISRVFRGSEKTGEPLNEGNISDGEEGLPYACPGRCFEDCHRNAGKGGADKGLQHT